MPWKLQLISGKYTVDQQLIYQTTEERKKCGEKRIGKEQTDRSDFQGLDRKIVKQPRESRVL